MSPSRRPSRSRLSPLPLSPDCDVQCHPGAGEMRNDHRGRLAGRSFASAVETSAASAGLAAGDQKGSGRIPVLSADPQAPRRPNTAAPTGLPLSERWGEGGPPSRTSAVGAPPPTRATARKAVAWTSNSSPGVTAHRSCSVAWLGALNHAATTDREQRRGRAPSSPSGRPVGSQRSSRARVRDRGLPGTPCW